MLGIIRGALDTEKCGRKDRKEAKIAKKNSEDRSQNSEVKRVILRLLAKDLALNTRSQIRRQYPQDGNCQPSISSSL
jgi:hypothetical protein